MKAHEILKVSRAECAKLNETSIFTANKMMI